MKFRPSFLSGAALALGFALCAKAIGEVAGGVFKYQTDMALLMTTGLMGDFLRGGLSLLAMGIDGGLTLAVVAALCAAIYTGYCLLARPEGLGKSAPYSPSAVPA